MSVLRWLYASGLGPVAIAVLFLTPIPFVGPAAPHGAGNPLTSVNPCPGASIGSAYSGSLSSEGGSLPPQDLRNVSIGFSYAYETTYINRSTGRVVAVTCTNTSGTAVTGPNATFSLTLGLPPPGCDLETGVCTNSTGPYDPFSVGPTRAAPTGFETVTTVRPSAVAVVFVAELASLAFDPNGPVVAYSPSANETVVARALAGDGSPTPGDPTFRWTLSGAGWRVVGTPDGSAVLISAAPKAGLGTLSVRAQLTVANATFSAGPANLSVEAVPTSVVASSENRSAVDAGGAVAISVTASGAPGYPYTAVVLPGLGLATSPLACASQPSGSTSESLLCASNITYPEPGVGTPEVLVSNGYSTATGALGPVTVNPPPALEVVPGAPDGYVGAALPIRLVTLPGSGTGPYREACLDPGDGPTICERSAGPNWTFGPAYGSAGTYLGTAWLWDAAGTNMSIAVPITVAPPLELGSISTSLPSLAAGEPVNLSSNLTGGFLPGSFWWNLSGIPGSIATGRVVADGALGAEWVPSVPGLVSLSVTVVDALGTEVERSTVVTVGADPTLSVSAVDLPSADPVSAGTPVGVAWQAFDGAGAPSLTFSATSELDASGAVGTAPYLMWVNASGTGPLASESPSVFEIPSAAWTLGRLNLSVTTVVAGSWTLRLVGLPGLPSPAALVIDVGPDLAHLRLYDPDVVLAGERTNRTYWHLQDRFGNPGDGATVEVDLSSMSSSEDEVTPVLHGSDGSAGVWVNYSAPTSAAGTLEVWSPTSGVLWGPFAFPAAPAVGYDATSTGALLVGLTLVAAALGTGAWAVRRHRRRPSTPGSPGELSEGELRRLVEGRERVIAAVGEAGVADLSRIEAAWAGSAPLAEISDWVASLVADGTLGARTGPDGVARFCLTGPPQGPARVVLDEAALAHATRLRDALVQEAEDDRGTTEQLP